jgi:hypothetical protein
MKNSSATIAALEKAVAEKYGKEAVQDFRSDWGAEKELSYLDQLKKRRSNLEHQAPQHEIVEIDDIVIKKKRKGTLSSRTCPLCKTYSFSPRDDLYMNRFETCRLCYYDFVVYREDDWAAGERPTDEQIGVCLLRRRK